MRTKLSNMLVFYVQPGKPFALQVADAFLQGCGGDVKIMCPQPGWPPQHYPGAAAAFYGVTRETLSIYTRVREQERLPWYYIDNGYFGAGHGPQGYLRATRQRQQHGGEGTARDPGRFAQFGIKVEPWRDSGRHVLICTQSEWWYERHGLGSVQRWVDGVTGILRLHTDRPIRVRLKPRSALIRPPNVAGKGELELAEDNRPLAADLADCWAVVTHSSNAAVEAILAGVPAFTTAWDAAAWGMGTEDLARIEDPVRLSGETRLAWARQLACQQWTLGEISSGKCWADLHA